MNVMYCVKCKSKTGTAQLQKFQTKNNKLMIGGTCVKCGIRKTQFISPEQASAIGAGDAKHPKKGGFVFTLPMLAAAAGIAASAATAGSTIASAVNSKKAKDKELAETKRHNMAMETKGKGLFLKPYRKGGNLGALFTAASRKIIQSQKQKKGKGLFLKTS